MASAAKSHPPPLGPPLEMISWVAPPLCGAHTSAAQCIGARGWVVFHVTMCAGDPAVSVSVFGRQDAFELGERREVEASRLGWDRAGAERARLMTIS